MIAFGNLGDRDGFSIAIGNLRSCRLVASQDAGGRTCCTAELTAFDDESVPLALATGGLSVQ